MKAEQSCPPPTRLTAIILLLVNGILLRDEYVATADLGWINGCSFLVGLPLIYLLNKKWER